MAESLRNELELLWDQLSRRYDWQLAPNRARLVDSAVHEAVDLACTAGAAFIRCLTQAIRRGYGPILYSGVVARRERACLEIWQMAFRVAVRHRPIDEAHDIAQETLHRIFINLQKLRNSRSMIPWSMRILASVTKDYDKKQNRTAESLDAETAVQIADPEDFEAQVLNHLVASQLVQRLRALLRNELEFLAALYCGVLGHKPGDLARRLGLPLSRVRVAKSRALQRLRDDTGFTDVLRGLAGD